MQRLEDINTADISDGRLLVRLRDGHGDSFGELVDRHRAAAMSVARRALPGDAASAEDAVEDAVAATLSAIRNGHGPELDFRPYFLAATRTAAIRISGRRLATSSSKDTRFTDGSEFATVEAAHELTVLNECFHRLRPAWRHVLWQVDVDGVPSPTVADQLGVSRRAVDAVCQRARRHLARDYVAHLLPVDTDGGVCASLQHQLSDYGLGMAAPDSGQLLESHLDQCPSCSARVAAVRRLPEQLPAVMPPAAVGVWKLLASLFISGGSASLSAIGVACVVVVAPIMVSDQPAVRSQSVIDSRAEGPTNGDVPEHTQSPATLGSRASSRTLSGAQVGEAPLTSLAAPASPAAVGIPAFDIVDELGGTLPGVDVVMLQPGVEAVITVAAPGVSTQSNVSIDPETGAVRVTLPLVVTTPITTIALDLGVDLTNGAAEVNVVTNITVPVLQLPLPTVSIVAPLPSLTLPAVTLPTVTLPAITLPDLHLF
jgi:RNA polymerase sigma factor (sigma-70 family)